MIRPGWRTSWLTTLFTFLNIYGEHTLEPLRPSHRVGLWFRVPLFFYRFLRNNKLTQLAIRRENPVKSREVDPRFRDQRPQPAHEFHGAERGPLRTT